MATIYGSNQNDTIKRGNISSGVSDYPTDSADTIYGYDGDDDIDGLLGADTIYAGAR